MAGASVAKAAPITWTGTTSTDFELGSNWGGTAPTDDLVTDIGLFTGAATANQPSLTKTRAINGLRFDTDAWTLSGGAFTLNLGAGGINAGAQITGTNTISATLGIGAAQTWQVGTGGTMAVTGDVTGTTFGIIKSGGGALTLSGIVGIGSGGFAVNGGTLTLTNTGNTFTGNITVDGSTSVLAFAGSGGVNGDPLALGSGSKSITLTNGGAVSPTSSSNPSSTNTKSFAIGTGGGTFNVATGVAFTLDDATQLSGAGDLTVTGSGTGTVILGQTGVGFATFTGNTIVNSGTLRLANVNAAGSTAGQTITVNSGGSLDLQALLIPQNITINGTGAGAGGALISGTAGSVAGTVTLAGNASIGGAGTLTIATVIGESSAGLTLTKVGAGNTVLSGASPNTYTGLTTVSAGTLTLGKTAGVNAIGGNLTVAGGAVSLNANDQIPNTAAVAVSSGSFDFNGKSETISSLTLTGGTTQTTGATGQLVTVTNAVSQNAASLTINSGTQWSSNSLSNTGSTTLMGGNNAVNETLYTVGSGGLTMSGATFTINPATTAGNLGGRLILNGDVTVTGTAASTFVIGTGTSTLAPRVDLGTGPTRTFTVADATSSAATDLTAGIALVGTSGLTKTGPGTMVLSNGVGNTFTGPTPLTAISINQGTLGATNDNQLGNAANGITLTTGGAFSVPSAATLTLGATRVITVGTGGGTLDVQGTPTTGKLLMGTAGQLVGSTSLTKTGPGDLQISAANTGFTGSVNANGGVIELQNAQALGTTPPLITLTGGEVAVTNSTWTGNLTAGVGGGTISGNSGNSTYSGTITASNPFNFGLRDFQTPATGRTLTVSGILTGASTVTLVGPTAGAGTLLLTANTSGFTGALSLKAFANLQLGGAANSSTLANANLVDLSGGTLTILGDGNGLATPELAATVTDPLTLSGSSAITVGKSVAAQALNKTVVASGGLTTNGAFTLTVNNNNQYGLNLTGATSITTAAPTFSVATATASNLVQGLALSAPVTGGFGFSKAGAGTLVLGSALNSFTGDINITQGTVSIASDTGAGATNGLGAAANLVALTPSTGTSALRATDNITTARVIKFGTASNTRAIEVVDGKTLTLTSAFDLSAAASASLAKNENGILAIGTDAAPVSNPTWTGAININAGGVKISHATALGSGAITVTNLGSALQLSGGITIVNPVTLNANSNQFGGINSGGSIQSVSGVNIYNGAITQTSGTAATLGADLGATLNFTGTYSSPGVNSIGFQGAGTINWQVPLHNAGQVLKFGTGTFNLSAASPLYVTALNVNGGTFTLSGAGTFGSAAVANTVTSGATLKVDDTGAAPVNNRLGVLRTMNLASGTFQYVANASGASVEGIGALTSSHGGNTIQVDTTAQSSTLTFASLASNVVAGGSTLTFKTAGTGANFGATSNTVLFTTAPTLSAPSIGIIPRAIVIDGNGTNFATYNNTGLAANTLGVQALASYNIPTISSTTNATTSVTVADTSVLTPGMVVYGPGITAGTTIASITNSTTYVLSAAASTSATANLTYGTTADTNINSFTSLRSAGENIKLGTGFMTNGNVVNSATRTFGSINLAGPGTTLNSGATGASSTYTLASGNLLSTGAGTNTIGAGAIVAGGATEIGLNIGAGNTLVVNGAITGAANVTKGLDGNVTFNSKQYFNTGANYFTINGGGTGTFTPGTNNTVTLATGINNTLFPGVQGATVGNYLAVGPGAALNLNGTAQLVGDLRSPNSNAFSGSGGIITTLTGASTLVNAGGVASNWGGQITGNVFFAKSGNNAFNIYSDQTFTGGLLLMGNNTQLIDSGKFSGLTASTPINLNFANLTISNTGTVNDFNRIPDAVPIISNGGSFTFNGRAQTVSTETLGVLKLVGGAGQINMVAGGTGVNSAELTFSGFDTTGVDGTINLNQNSTLGSGVRISFLSAPTVINGVTPQFESGGGNLATYIPGIGLAQIDATGGPGYDATTTLAITSGPASAIRNIKLSATGVVPDGGLFLNSLHANSQNVTFGTNASDTLTLTSGVLMGTGAFSIGATVDSGRLTASGGAITPAAAVNNANGNVPLYAYSGSGTRTINSRIVDPNGSANLRLIISTYNAAFYSLTNGANSYSGGTVVNGWFGNSPTNSGLTLNGAAGQVVVPAGGLTLNHALVTEVTNGGQINPANVVTLNGGSTLTLVLANTLNSLVFNNIGDVTNPTVATGGVLSLTNPTPISVILPSNPATVATISGTLDFANASKTIFIDPTTVNGQAIAPLTAGLNITAVIQNAGQIVKTGLGNLQLTSTTSAFTGGVNLSQGGLIISGNSAPSTVGSTVTAGPLGTGTLTIGANTTLLAGAASTVANPVTVSGNFTFDGITNLTLNGNVALPSANTAITVAAPQMTATFGGVLSNASASLTKNGLGILVLGNNNTYGGGTTLNSGTLQVTAPNPLGTGSVTINGGLLQLRSNTGSIFGNNVTLSSGLTNAFIDIAPNGGAQTNNSFIFGTLTSQPTTTLNVSGSNGYKLQFTGTNLTTAFPATPATFNPASGLTIILPGGFNDNNRPINIGQGLLAFSGNNTFTTNTTITGTQIVAPQANSAATPYGTGSVILSNGSTLQITPTPGNLNLTNYTQGGLAGRFYSFTAAPLLTALTVGGLVPGAVVGGMPSSDTDIFNHPVNVLTTGGPRPVQDQEQYTGILKVTNAGLYNFGLDKDDEGVLFVDGVRVLALGDGSAGASAAGGYAAGFTTASLALTAGSHSITVMHQNGAGGSGIQLIYNGPDTTAGPLAAPGVGWQGIAVSNLSYNTTGVANAGNNYLSAAQVNNDVILAAGNSATLDGVTSQLNSAVGTLNLGNNSTLTVNNVEGTGFIGSIGTTQVGSGVTINTGTGVLYLIGGVTDTPTGVLATAAGATGTNNGLTKIGNASLTLGPSAGTFNGTLNVFGGGLVVAAPNALTTGSTIVGNPNLTTVTGGTTLVAGTTVTVTSTAGLFVGQGVNVTGGTGTVPAGAFITSITSPTQFVLSAAATAGTPTSISYYSGATLDLNGISNVAGNITLNGAGPAQANTLAPGALYNSNAAAASVAGTVAIGTAINAKVPTIGGYGDITINGSVTDGVAGQAWSKVGPNTLNLAGNNTFTGALTVTMGMLKLGSVNSLGTSTTNGVTFTTGAGLDLNGQSPAAAKTLTFGAGNLGLTGYAVNNTLGALINNAPGTTSTYAGALSWTGALGIGSSSFDAANPGGDIILSAPVLNSGTTGIGINKVGQDTVTILGSVPTTTGGHNIQLGTLILTGAAGAFTGGSPVNISGGATLKLDNSVTNLNNRLGNLTNAGTFLTVNGNLTIIGNAGGTQETISTATNGKPNFVNSGSVITLQPDAAGGLLFNFTSNIAFARTAGATSLFRGAGLGTAPLASFTGAANPGVAGFGDGTQANPGYSGNQVGNIGTNRGVLAWALIDQTNTGLGTSFVTYDTTNGFQPLIFALNGQTDSLALLNANTLLTAPITTIGNTGQQYINSLTLNNPTAPIAVTIGAGSVLPLISGGLLNLSGTAANPNTITGPGALAVFGNNELIVHSVGTSVLNIGAQIANSTGNFTKADGGTVILSAKELYLGNTVVNGGVLQFAGNNQTIYIAPNAGQGPGATGFTSNSQVTQLNQGGTLDLNGTNQMLANLNSGNTLPGSGGILTNTSATLSTFQTVLNGTQTFAGSINGNLNFVRSSGFFYTLESPSNFSGTATMQGGQTILQDLGAFTGTSAINLNGGALTWTDTGTQAVTNRLPVAAPVNFNTGAFTYNARNGVQGAISIGNATFNSGGSLITVSPNNGGANLTIGTGTGASLTHNVGGTVTFFSGGAQASSIGDQAHVYLAANPTLTNGIIGAWATAYQNDSFIGQSTQPGFAVYTTNGIENLNKNLVTIATGSVPAGANARANASLTLPTGGVTLNTLSIINAAVTLTFTSATDTLTLTTGGVLTGADANAKVIGAAVDSGRLTAGAGQPELFLHVGNNTLTVNSRIVDNGVGGGLNVVIGSMGANQAANAVNSTIALTAPNTYLGTTYLNGIQATLNSTGGPAIPGNLVITGGVWQQDSLNSTTTLAANNQIAPTATVTLKGGATLSLAGFNNTIANLTLDNTSGDLNGVGGTLNTGSGMLTVSGTISETNNTNSFLVPQLNGFVTLSNAAPTISIAANPINAAQVGLNISAALAFTAPSATPLVLSGGGVIGVSSQNSYPNGTSVASGTTLAFGQAAVTTGAAATFASLATSQVNLAGGAILDTRGNNGVIGSLTGTGTVTNNIAATNTAGTLTTANVSTLTTGADNVASVTFDGTFVNPFVQSLLNVTKIGSGTMVLTADNSGGVLNSPNLGTLTVSRGLVSLSGPAAKVGFSTNTLQTSGTLTLDNSTNPVSNRLGGQYLLVSPTVATTISAPRTLSMQGGTLNVSGNNGTAITEGIGQLNFPQGGVINITSVGTSGVTIPVFNVGAQSGQSSLRINADNLGIAAAGTAGNSNVPVTGAYVTPGTQGAGVAGSTLIAIRPDIIATDTASGVSAFVFKDATNGLRLLNPANEYLTTTSTLVPNAAVAAANAFNLALSSSSANQGIATNTPVGSLTLLSGGGLVNTFGTSGGSFGGAGLETLTIGSAGVLAVSGNTGINIGAMTSAGITMDVHVVGAATTLNLNGSITATTNGIVKADDGTLSLNASQFFTGAAGTNGLTINGGKVVLNAGANTVLVQPTGTVPVVQSLFVNAGTLDLNGNSQAFERIASVNTAPGQTNNIITSTSAANLISVPATTVSTTYGGKISGALSFYKSGTGSPTSSTMTLTSVNDYTGSTNIQGGVVALRDSGALTATSAININYAQLTLDNTGLSDSTTRISPTVPVNLNGGTFFVAAGQAVESQSIGTGTGAVTLAQGLNQFSTAQYNNSAQTGSYTLNVGNLVQQNNATLVFSNATNVTFGLTSGNPHVFLSQLNGAAFTAANLTNNLIGGWAIANNGLDFASYTNAAGVGGLSVAGFPTYSGAALGAGVLTDNINVTATVQSVTSRTINSLAVRAPAAATTIGLFDASQVLNLGTGGLLINTAQTVAIQGGQLTAGGAAATPASLYIYTNGAGAQTINSQIVNNAASGAVVSLVRSGGGTITLNPLIVDTVATITAATATFNVNNTAGLFVGMAVTGTGIPANEFITGIAGNTITITTGTGVVAGTNIQTTFTPPASAATSGTTINSNTVTTAANAFSGGAAFLPTAGMAIGGPNILGGTTITAVTGTNATGFTLTLSQPAIATSATAVVTVGALSNTYTGATVNNGGSNIFGVLNLSGQPGSIVVPGDLTIGNAGVTMVTNQGQIAPTSNVTWVSGGTLTLVGTNTLNSLNFNGNGTSGGTGTAAVGTLLNLSQLTGSASITSINNDLGHTPTVSGTALALTNATPVINTSGLSPIDLVISAPITSAGGQITKTGTGSVVLSGANTFTTGVNLSQGSLIFGVASVGTPPAITSGPVGTGTLTLSGGGANSTIFGNAAFTIGNAVSVTGGGFTFGGTVAANNLTLSGVVTLGAGANAINVSSPLVTGTISGQLTGGTDLTKSGPGILVLSNATNNFGGATIVSGGVLKNGVANALPNTSLLTVNAGGEYDLNAFAQITQQIAGTGLITNSGAAATLTLGGISATDVTTNVNSSFAGGFTNAAAALNLQLVGLGNTTLSGLSNHTGTTTIKTGTLTGGATNAFSPNSTIVIGNNGIGVASTQGFLDVTNFSEVIGGLTIQTDSTNGNVMNIGAGKTLTLTGNVLVGENLAVAGVTTTTLTPTGGGTLAVNNTAANSSFVIGGQTSATANAANTANVDLSGLSAFNVSLNTTNGVFRVANLSGTNVVGGVANLILPATTTITTATLAVGDGGQFNNGPTQINTLKLGSGVTTINAGGINIGTGARDIGSVTFNGASGSVIVRDTTGTGRASFNVGSGGATTGTTAVGVNDLVDFTGHSADLLLSNLTIMNQARTGALNADFKFDTGTLDATSVQAGFRTGSAPSNATLAGTLSIGGGSVIIGTGGVDLGNNTNTGTTAALVSGVLNISGGTVSVANSPALGGAIRLGNNSAASGSITASGALNVSGGTTTVAGDIVRGTATRTTSTLSLTGGTLDLGTHNIGTTALPITATFAAGTLANLGQFDGGAALNKTTAGTMILAGTNTYTGPTNVTAGTLLVNAVQGAATGVVTVSSGATLGGTGTIGGATTIQDGGSLKPGASAGLLTFASNLTLSGNTTNTTFELQGTTRGAVGGYDAINLGATSTLTYAGILTLDISSTLPAGTYDLFSFTNPPSGSFFNVTLAGGFSGNLTNNSGVWTGNSLGSSFTFTEATGDLLVVPEPSALVSLLGGLGVLLGFRRARRALVSNR
ncbi:MAG: hypothetical protein QOE70_4540 [Chthoniobacter sp.]|nr:hypothetical protein [Chthoniobacter sp.]